MLMNYAGRVPLSTVDWPGKAVTTIFLNGCPLRCPYCINAEMRTAESWQDIDLFDILDPYSVGLINGIVISGGEPLMQEAAVRLLAHQAHEIDIEVAVETSGYYPEALEEVLWNLDAVFIDMKEVFTHEAYTRATQVLGVWPRVFKSLELLMRTGTPFQARTTVFDLPGYILPTSEELEEIIVTLKIMSKAYPQNRYMGFKLQQGILPESYYGIKKRNQRVSKNAPGSG